MGSDLRKTLKLKVKQPKVKSLKDLAGKLGERRPIFVKRYGKILELLEADIQTEALTALAQFYDPPLRCFTFRDFQLAPTLEEFAQILGYPLEGQKPYLFIGHYPSPVTVSGALSICVKKKENKGGVNGFSRGYLEEHAQKLAQEEKWDAFMDVLALLIYGVIIFPNIDDFVDFAAIDVFLAYKMKKENPVPAILADLYYMLHLRHEKKGGVILCCLPVLYKWLTYHMVKSMGRVEIKSSREWAQATANLDEKTVHWYSREQEINEVIYQCGDFPNVPLMGTKGCINYNPAQALRQLGYPMMGPPTEEMVSTFFLQDLSAQNIEMMKQVRRVWDKIVRKGRELGRRSCDAKESYRQWLRDRFQKVKLPFRGTVQIVEEMSVQPFVNEKEVEKLKAALLKSEEEKKKLQGKLEEVLQVNKDLQRESTQKMQSLENANKRARVDEKCRLKTQSCLKASNKEMEYRGREKNEALAANQQLKDMLKNSKIVERNAKRQLEVLNQQLERVVAEYEKRVDNEKRCKEDAIEMAALREEAWRREQEKSHGLRNHIEDQKIIIKQLDDENAYLRDQVIRLNSFVECQETLKQFQKEGEFWRDRYANLAELTNQALINIPRFLKEAEKTMNPFTTPTEVSDFIKHCKEEIEELKKGCVVNGVHVQVWVQCTPI